MTTRPESNEAKNLVSLRRPPQAKILRPQRDRAETRVGLVVMPLASRSRPSIQVGLLTAIGRARGFTVTPLYLNLDFAKQIGSRAYEAICSHRGCVSGEWLFAREAFGDAAPDDEAAFFETVSRRLDTTLADAKIDRARYAAIRREEVPKYLDAMMASVDWSQFDVVGFTSCFEQNVACIALAARIKRKHPSVITLFGGANFDGEMGPELVRTIDAIDYAVVGEGDEAFPEFLEALHEGRDPASVPGVVCRRDGRVAPPIARAPFTDLDSLPTPLYQEYFARSEELRLSSRSARGDQQIFFESARGCWWGAKHHCTFCGLNNQSMKFRAKSPGRVKSELADLAIQTESFRFQAVDNILDTGYLETLLPELAKTRSDYTLFYEIKSNLTRAQVKVLADGGVRAVQPGIESLSSHVLSLMRKGIKAIQQVNMLRWAQYYGIRAEWSILWGFPGETETDYREQIALFQRIRHIRPPSGSNRIWMERFSPIYFDDAFKKTAMRPEATYAHVYPANVDLERVAYFFDYEMEGVLPEDVYADTEEALTVWRDSWNKSLRRPCMFYWSSPGLVRIDDRRDPAAPEVVCLKGIEAALYVACSDAPRTAEAALKSIAADDADVEAAQRALESLDERGLVMREGEKFLALAIPAVEGR